MNSFVKRTLVLMCSAVLTAGCASTAEKNNTEPKASVQVERSFLKQDTVKTNQNDYQFGETQLLKPTGNETIPTMAQ